MLPPRQRQKEATRARLLAAAEAEFIAAGWVNASTARIATAAGVAHGTVFVHFPTREALLTALVIDRAIRDTAELRAQLAQAADLQALCERHLAWVDAHEDYAAMLARELPALSQRVQLTLVASRSAIAEAFLAALDRGATAGTLRPVDGPTAFAFWQGTLDYHLVHRHLFAADGRVIRARGPALIRFFVTALQHDALQHDALQPRGSE